MAELVPIVCQATALEPGDMIATGTPRVAFARIPPGLLEEGDLVTVDIEATEALTNPVCR